MQIDRRRWRSGTWIAAAVLIALLAIAFSVAGFGGGGAARTAVAIAAATTAVVVIGAVLRTRGQRRRYEEELAEWAGERAAQAERLRIARDLHDLASHGLGAITLRAATAQTAGEEERSRALVDIESTGREATTELRRMLTVLRGADPPSLRPTESLDDLPRIVTEAEGAGLVVELEIAEPGDVSPGVQLTVCAIVREALRNTVRHAGPTSARVRIQRHGETIALQVRDRGAGPEWSAQPGAGHGLQGLRERVTALDGSLEAGPVGDGWMLTARLPDRTAR